MDLETEHELTILGATVRAPVEHVEVFPAPATVTEVRLSSDEVASICPVTSQPDLSTIEITYVPDQWCVETKSLKLYLWGFRQRPVFAEALAAEVAGRDHGDRAAAPGPRRPHAAPARRHRRRRHGRADPLTARAHPSVSCIGVFAAPCGPCTERSPA